MTTSARTKFDGSPVARALRDGLVVPGLIFLIYLFAVIAPAAGTFGFDAFAYWNVDPTAPYRLTAGALGAFTYSPVIARAFSVGAALPFWQFLWLWSALLVATVVFLGGRSRRTTLLILAFPPVALELYHGNVHLLIAAAIVLGFRHPAAWALPVLTKVTPGVGLVWFAVRREWRSLGIALAATGAIVAVSLLLDGPLWVTWISESLGRTAAGAPLNQFEIPVPLLLRLPLATVLVAWGARTDRRWTVPLGVTLAMPILWPTAFAVLAAVPLLTRHERISVRSVVARPDEHEVLRPGAVAANS